MRISSFRVLGTVGLTTLLLSVMSTCVPKEDVPPIVTFPCTSAHVDSPPTEPCVGSALSDDVCIAGGEFVMGHCALPYTPPSCPPGKVCGPGDPPPIDYAPPHIVKLSPFFMDRYPATNGQYKECYDAGECPPTCYQEQSCLGGHYSDNDMTDPQLADYPVSTITIQGAEAYCRWKGKRLPTEAEWERAARGPEGFDYPWGNEAPDCTHYICNPTDVPAGWWRFYFSKVGTNPGDVSPEGVHDMVTSARQLVYDYYDYHYYNESPYENPAGPSRVYKSDRVARGDFGPGGPMVYNGVESPLPAWARSRHGDGDWIGGVRCARSDEGTTPPIRPAPGPTLIHGIAPFAIKLDDTRIYFSALDLDTIHSALKDGSDVRELANGLKNVYDLVVDGDYVYATVRGTHNAAKEYQHDGAIVRIPKNGGAPETLAASLEGPVTLALDGGFLYWVNGGDWKYKPVGGPVLGSVMRIPASGGTPEVLAADQLKPNSLVVRDGFVYWANWGTIYEWEGTPNGGVYRVPTAGGPIEMVADAQSAPNNLVYGNELLWIVRRHAYHGQIVALRNGQVTPLGSEQEEPGSMTPYAGTIVWHFSKSLLAMDGTTGAVTATWPNDDCYSEWFPMWVGFDGVFWGCSTGNDYDPGEMRYMKPW